MRYPLLVLVVSALIFSPGCRTHTPSHSKSKLSASELAKQLRELITSEEMMSLEFVGTRASDNGGLRVYRQVEIAQPVWFDLVRSGDGAREQIAKLLEDRDESVRLCTVTLLAKIKVSRDLQLIEESVFRDSIIPLLEQSLKSGDDHVRYFAVCGLGDLHRWSDPCLDRLKDSLPTIRTLQHDQDHEVRAVAFIAYQWILGALSTRSKDPSIRQSSATELAQLGSESW